MVLTYAGKYVKMIMSPTILVGFFICCSFDYCGLIYLWIDNQFVIWILFALVCQLAIAFQKQYNYVNNPASARSANSLLGNLQIHRLVRKYLKL